MMHSGSDAQDNAGQDLRSRKEDILQGRKGDHIRICLHEDVDHPHNYWDDVQLQHDAIPVVDLDAVDIRTSYLGVDLQAPIFVAAMTGGYAGATLINETLARACSELGLGMGLGSMRAALKDDDHRKTYSIVREYDVPLRIGNIGAPQLVAQHGHPAMTIDEAKELLELIDGHALALHLNYPQEVVQPEGDTNATGVLEAIEDLSKEVPIILKETGAGISQATFEKVKSFPIKGVDVGGASGTSFSAVEYYRAVDVKNRQKERLGKTFWDWGIPTPYSAHIASEYHSDVIATGGIRNGLDVARAISVGAKLGGIAKAILPAAVDGLEQTKEELSTITEELRCAVYMTGCAKVDELSRKPYRIMGKLLDWFQ